jgi:thymidylate kinase
VKRFSFFPFMMDTNQRGLWVAVFGPDGAGKSAVIKRVADGSPAPFRGIQKFHFRPRFRRQWFESPPAMEPHAQSPRGAVLSIFKLFYWLADCWYGYVFIVRPARAGSRLVLFDRYLYDILVDPLRYRLPRSCLWFARLVVLLAPRPDLYVLLDVPAEMVQQRKAEVSPEESHRQRLAYREMFRPLPNAFLVDAVPPVDEVAEKIKTVILESLTRQAINRSRVSLTADA